MVQCSEKVHNSLAAVAVVVVVAVAVTVVVPLADEDDRDADDRDDLAAQPSSSWHHDGKFSDVWGKVGDALQDSGYAILEQDKAMGVYYVWLRSQADNPNKEPDVTQVKVKQKSESEDLVTFQDEMNQPLSKDKAL